MNDLHSSILSAIEDPNVPVWFPLLTNRLMENGWKNLLETYGIKESNYSTGGMLRSKPDEFVNNIVCLNPAIHVTASLPPLKVYTTPHEIESMYTQAGAMPYTSQALQSSTIFECLEESLGILASATTVYETVASLVFCMHILQPEDDHYDVSYSLPNIPFSIFVSVPSKRMANDSLRVAEAILHEAMHLQLSLIEKVIPLVDETEEKYFSPWKNEYRHPRGILHALYVFQVIYLFFDRLIQEVSSHTGIEYISSRQKAILSQVSELKDFLDCPKLTHTGKALTKKLFTIE